MSENALPPDEREALAAEIRRLAEDFASENAMAAVYKVASRRVDRRRAKLHAAIDRLAVQQEQSCPHVTMRIEGPCEAVWQAQHNLGVQLRGWHIVSEATHGDIGRSVIEAVLVNETRRFNAYPELAEAPHSAAAAETDCALPVGLTEKGIPGDGCVSQPMDAMTTGLPIIAWFAETLGVKFAHVTKQRVADWIGSDGDCAEPINERPLTDHATATALLSAAQERVAELERENREADAAELNFYRQHGFPYVDWSVLFTEPREGDWAIKLPLSYPHPDGDGTCASVILHAFTVPQLYEKAKAHIAALDAALSPR